MTDFGADESFGQATKKINEHYGIEVPIGAVQTTTKMHARKMLEDQELKSDIPQEAGAPYIIAETDGTMVPIVTFSDNSDVKDRRKKRQVVWKEARLCFSRVKEAVDPVFKATMGSVDRVGDLLLHSAIEVGMGAKTIVHGVGDGAKWIKDQFDRVFAQQATYLIDFFHLCEYLQAASDTCGSKDSTRWYESKKKQMKASKHTDVIVELSQHLEPDTIEDDKAPVRACHRYLSNRKGQLDYQRARKLDLPIGSGEIEGSHRSVIQKRLKLPGAWWLVETVDSMLTLRCVRANQQWDSYWAARWEEVALAQTA